MIGVIFCINISKKYRSDSKSTVNLSLNTNDKSKKLIVFVNELFIVDFYVVSLPFCADMIVKIPLNPERNSTP